MRLIPTITIALLVAGLAGCVESDAHDDHDHDEMDDHDDHMDGMDDHAGHASTMDISQGGPDTTVRLEAFTDPKAGFNVHIITENWEWAPLLISTDHTPGQGHGHIYIDDVQIGRVFTDWVHVNGLEPGAHTIKVSLNSNTHAALVRGEVPVADEVGVVQPSPEDGMSHMHPEAKDITGEGECPDVEVFKVHADPADPAKAVVAITSSGWTFAPEDASTEHEAGHGHAHVYLDGVKLGRMYGHYYHIGGLADGDHTLRVTLNANDHSDLTCNGDAVEDSLVFTVTGSSVEDDGMDSMGDMDHDEHDGHS